MGVAVASTIYSNDWLRLLRDCQSILTIGSNLNLIRPFSMALSTPWIICDHGSPSSTDFIELFFFLLCGAVDDEAERQYAAVNVDWPRWKFFRLFRAPCFCVVYPWNSPNISTFCL